MSSFGRSRNNVDTRLIGFPPCTTMRGGNDIAILRHLYLRIGIDNQEILLCEVLAAWHESPAGKSGRTQFFYLLSGKRLANIIIAD